MTTGPTNPPTETTKNSPQWPWLILTTAFFALVFVFLLQAAMHKQLNHDEHMYISSGVLLLQGQLPYSDYPYFQMPLLTLVYAAAFSIWPDYLLVARLINVLCAFGACVLLFAYISKLLAASSPVLRFSLAAASVILYISGSQFVYASGIAWNHDLPILLTIAALFVLLPWDPPTPLLILSVYAGVPSRLLLLSGFLLGLAISARSLFVLAAVPIMAAFLFEPLVPDSLSYFIARKEPTAIPKVRLFYLSRFGAGMFVGLLASLPFFLLSPSAFIFGNFTYHGVNEQYWRTLNYDRAMTLPTKLSYSFDILLAEPSLWLLVPATIVALVLALRFRGQAFRLSMLLSFPIAIALFIGTLIPTPTWLQYFYSPYALLAITFTICTALIVRRGRPRAIIPLFALVTLISAAAALPQYLSLGNPFSFSDWTPYNVANTSREIKAHLSRGTVVTLSPLFPLQAGLRIYPTLSTGPFGYRVANTLPSSTRTANNLPNAADIVAQMTARPPEGILTGAEGTLEYPLSNFAIDHNYTATPLSNNLTLWLRPK